MIGMPVVAVPVVGDQDVRVLLIEDARQPAAGLIQACLHEAHRIAVLRPARHPGVVVTQPGHSRNAQHSGGRLRLGTPTLRNRLARGQVFRDGAVLTAGGEDHDDTVASFGGEHHRPRGLARLIVWMGVEEDQCGHQYILPVFNNSVGSGLDVHHLGARELLDTVASVCTADARLAGAGVEALHGLEVLAIDVGLPKVDLTHAAHRVGQRGRV